MNRLRELMRGNTTNTVASVDAQRQAALYQRISKFDHANYWRCIQKHALAGDVIMLRDLSSDVFHEIAYTGSVYLALNAVLPLVTDRDVVAHLEWWRTEYIRRMRDQQNEMKQAVANSLAEPVPVHD